MRSLASTSKEVRWALTLAIDIVRVSLASYRGAATLSAIHVPPTGLYPKYYFEPLQSWLNDFTIDVGGSPYKPFDAETSNRVAEEARKTLGDLVPTDPERDQDRARPGLVEVRPGGGRETDAGGRDEEVGRQVGPARRLTVQDRTGQCGREQSDDEPRGEHDRGVMEGAFGIDARHDARDNTGDLVSPGDYSAAVGWTIETWGGHPDLFYFLSSWHSKFYKPSGTRAVGSNTMRWKHPELDRIITDIQSLDFDDPKGIELGQEFIKLAAAEMPITPMMSYNVFTVCDTTFFEGYPTVDNPYTNPVPNWGNTKYMFTKIKPKS